MLTPFSSVCYIILKAFSCISRIIVSKMAYLTLRRTDRLSDWTIDGYVIALVRQYVLHDIYL